MALDHWYRWIDNGAYVVGDTEMTYEEALETIAADRAAREETKKNKLRENQRCWNERHPDRRRAMNERWKKNNPEKVRAAARRRYALNPEKEKQRSKTWKENNRAHCLDYTKQYAKTNKEQVYNANRRCMLRTKYNLTPEEWDQLFLEQNFSCAICGSENPNNKNGRWHTDHDHQTGAVRGILCHNCNHLLGQAKDSVDTLFSAIEYLGGYDE